MGCGSSVAQVSDSTKDGLFKPIRLLDAEKESEAAEVEGRLYLFGETRTQRKIVELDLSANLARLISNRVRIPVPRIHYDPIELMYEQSQEIFHLGVYGLSVLPPFNKMLALAIQSNALFLCGGKDFDRYNIKNETFYYSINDEAGRARAEGKAEAERTEMKTKYSMNKFQKLASMNAKRYGHMGLYIHKLKSVMVFGGLNEKEEILNSCERYGVLDNCWKDMPPMHVSRAFGNCFEYNGKVYVFGGRTTPTKKSKKIQVFDCETHQWQILGFKIHRGIEEALIFSQNANEIMIVGGRTVAGPTKSVIKVDLYRQTYIWDSSLSFEYQSVKGVKTKFNIMVFGGQKDTIELYANGAWTSKPFEHKKCVEQDEMELFSFSTQSLHVAAREVEKQGSQVQKQDAILFGNDDYPCMLVTDLKKAAVTKQSLSLKIKIRSKMAVVEYEQGRYFLAGGCDSKGKKSYNSCYLYNSATNQFQETVKMTEKKFEFAICALDGFIYVFGGYDSLDKAAKKSCAKFCLANEYWDMLPTLRRARRKCFAQVVSSNKIAVFGGTVGVEPVAGIEILHVHERKFDIYEPTLHLPLEILCSYATPNNENSIFIFNKSEGNVYELTTLSLLDGTTVNTNRSVLSSNNLETIDIGELVKSKASEQKSSEAELPRKSDSVDNMHVIRVKPTMVEIQPKKLESQSSQLNFGNVVSEDLDHSFEMEKIDLRKNKISKLETKDLEEGPLLNKDAINEQVEDHFGIEKEESIKVESLIERTEQQPNQKQEQKPVEQPKQQPKTISSQPVSWLTKQEYIVLHRPEELYFFSDSQCIEYHKNTGKVRKMQLDNSSNVSMSMIK